MTPLVVELAGRDVTLVETREQWNEMTSRGILTLSLGEMQRLRTAQGKADPEKALALAVAVLDLKEIFGSNCYLYRGVSHDGQEPAMPASPA